MSSTSWVLIFDEWLLLKTIQVSHEFQIKVNLNYFYCILITSSSSHRLIQPNTIHSSCVIAHFTSTLFFLNKFKKLTAVLIRKPLNIFFECNIKRKKWQFFVAVCIYKLLITTHISYTVYNVVIKKVTIECHYWELNRMKF